ncbi:MAG: hypothetical protein ACRCSF_05060, partial [Mycobacteriaceae bacterium]
TNIDDAPPPPVPYICNDTPAPSPSTPNPSQPPQEGHQTTSTTTAPSPSTTHDGPAQHPHDPLTQRTETDNTIPGPDGLPTINGDLSDILPAELEKLVNISVRNFDIAIRTLREQLMTFARIHELDYYDVLADAEQNALRAVFKSSNPSADDTCGKPFNGPVGEASHEGDFFYSDSCTKGVNHGHNGIFVNLIDTVEASDEKAVHLSPNAAASWRLNPKKYYVKTEYASNAQKTGAARYAEKQIGKAYNLNGFAFNRQGGEDVTHYNCSQLVWASYYEPYRIDLDVDSDGGLWNTVTPNPGVYPRDLTDSKKTVSY